MVSRSILASGSDCAIKLLGAIPSRVLAGTLLVVFSQVATGAQAENIGRESYSQTVTIVFADESAAKQARIRIEPLFDGFHRAVSCRWDDNWTSDNEKTREVMERFGIKGTWYLNGRYFYPGGEPADYLPTARNLLKGGNSIGGHSLTHPYLTYFHSNRMFAETSGVRIDWEAELEQPVVSYAYSFVDLRPLPEGVEVLNRSLQSLQRAGFYHVAEFLNFFDDVELQLELSPIMPPENSPFDAFEQAVDWAYQDKELAENCPMISNSMHAWYDTERLDYGYDELEKRLRLLAELENVWHCNQNEYAAYRRQFRNATLSSPVVRKNEVEVSVNQRPLLLDLNNGTPLTVSVAGIDAEKVVDVRCPKALVKSSDRGSDETFMFHLWHDRTQRLPVKIGRIANPANTSHAVELEADPDFPTVRGVLWATEEQLRLRVACGKDEVLENLRVAWRLPIGWEGDSSSSQLPKQQRSYEFTQPLVPTGDPQDRIGRAHFAAQVDFTLNGEPGRIHFTCQQEGESPDDRWPIDGFAVLGPIPNEQFDAVQVAERVESEGCPEIWPLTDGTQLTWRNDARDGYVTQEWLNPEYVRTQGTWDHFSPSYLLRSKVQSPTDRDVQIIVSHGSLSQVVVDGKRVSGKLARLTAGENEVVVVYPGTSMSPENRRMAACFLRIADPTTGRPLDDITYTAF